jgi:hypothetical protein
MNGLGSEQSRSGVYGNTFDDEKEAYGVKWAFSFDEFEDRVPTEA